MTKILDSDRIPCPWCESSFDKLGRTARIHVKNEHGKSPKDLYDSLFGPSFCLCGCGTETRFVSFREGYCKYVKGHSVRVYNPWGHNPKALAKSHETCRKKRANGEMPAWSKGLTRETDPRIAASIEKGCQTILSDPERRQARSDRMREGRRSGQIPTLYGKDHSQWKGGTSSIAQLARSQLYNVWSYPLLKTANFLCTECGLPGTLEVHHSGERFASILRKAMEATGGAKDNDDWEGKEKTVRWIVTYHVEQKVPGIVLCRDCHDLIHEFDSTS